MTLEPFDFRDPAALVREIAREVELSDGAAYLALVAHPSTEQRLVRVDRLRTPAEIYEYDGARDEIRRVIRSWPLPDSRRPRHAAVLVVVRPGLCVFGPNEAQWFLADRYVNHFQPLFTGNTVLVTEHGWAEFRTGEAGHEPAMVPAGVRPGA